MLVFFLLIAATLDLVPMRWNFGELASLELLDGSPVNCLLIERQNWRAELAPAAAARKLKLFGLLRSTEDSVAASRQAALVKMNGLVLEGKFDDEKRASIRKVAAGAGMEIVELPLRADLNFDSKDAVIGTAQGLWPGVQAQDEADHKAGPSGAPWIDTNTGFLRFVQSATTATFWMGNPPPRRKVYAVERYLQAIGDAAMTGARWVVALDEDMSAKLLVRDKTALAGWKRINQALRFYEENRQWRSARSFARLALIADERSGALLSGGVLDMISVKHTPVRPIPPARLNAASMAGATMAVNIDPQALGEDQRRTLTVFTRAGGTLLTGPPGWKFPTPKPGQITLEKEDLKKLDEIWRDLNALTGRKNLGARLFNVSTMLSNLLESVDGKQVVLHLVNYSDYPVENVTIHLLGRYRSATLLRPEQPGIALSGYEIEEGTGFDVEQVGSVAALVLERAN